MTEIDSTMMRFVTPAIPVAMATGGTAADLTDFPISYPLADFCRFYWRVKTWTITYDMSFDIAEPGGTRNQSYSGAYSVSNKSGTDHRETDRIRDAKDWTTTAYASLGFNNTESIHNPDFIIGAISPNFDDLVAATPPFIYGYYDAPEDGTPGFLIPRLRLSFTGGESSPFFIFRGQSCAFDVNQYGWHDGVSWHPYSSGTNGTLTFDGHTIPIQWEASLDTESTITISSLNITVTAASYFEYSDGVTPFWNATTGEKII